MASNTMNAQELYTKKKISMATTGMKIALLMPFTAIIQNIFNSGIADSLTGALGSEMMVSVITSITLVALGDIIAGIFTLIYNAAQGKGISEYKRTCSMKISWVMLLAAGFAGPLATGCWMAATPFCGLTMVAVVTSLGPILTAFFSRIFLHEKLNGRIYLGIIIVVGGAIVSGWEGVSGGGSNYIVGLILALMAPIGFSLEGQISTYAGDIVDPTVGCGFFRCFGAGVIGLIAMAILAGATGNIGAFGQIIVLVLTTPKLLVFALLMALCGALNYNCAYTAFNKTGPSRTLAIDSSRPLWSIPCGYLFAAMGVAAYSVTTMGIIGAVIIVAGLLLVIANPKDLVNLRNVE